MTMKKILFLFPFWGAPVFSQQLPAPINSVEIYQEGMKLYNDQKYEEALAEFEKVDRNDTNYYAVLVEKAIVLMELKKYDEAADACREGLALNSSETHNFYINLGVTLDRAKKPEEALTALEEGISKFPKNYLLFYNKGIVYKSMGKLQESLEMFKQTILLNPYHAGSHLNLALLAADEGKIIPAVLSFNMYLILNPNGNSSNAVLKRLNEIVSSKYEKKSAGIQLSPEGSDDFSELDLLVTNYAALSKGYKVPVKSELPLVKQNYMILTKLAYEKKDPGFWMQTYVPFFKEILSKDWFDEFTYYILQSSGNDDHIKLVKKNTDGIQKFSDWAGPQIDNMNAVRPVKVEGKTQPMKHWYDSRSHYLKSICNTNADNTKLVGYCENYFLNGRQSSRGYFNNAGNKDGAWIFYHQNGEISEEVIYKDGKINGSFKVYYDNGNIKREGTFTDGLQEGIQKEYNAAGMLTSSTGLKRDLLDGKFTLFYDLGKDFKNYEGFYREGKITDSLLEFYDNGVIASRKKLTDNITNGNVTSYYRNGKIASAEKLNNNTRDGEFKVFFTDGKLRQEGQYKEGTEVGLWRSFYKNGVIEEELQYDEKGKKNGISKNYDLDGKLHYELEYLKGELVGYKFFDKTGKVIKEDRKKKGEFDYIGYFPRGNKKMEGIYTVNGKKGLWKYYDEAGNLTAEENYNQQGQLQGKSVNYFLSKKVKNEASYNAGQDDGYYVSFFRNGHKDVEGWFKDGKRQGSWISYQPDGALESKNYYHNGKLNGYQQYFWATGKLDHEDLYKEDVNEKAVYYDTSGNAVQTILMKAGNGDYVLYYNNNKPSFSGKYVAGNAHGDFIWYRYDGKIATKGAYYNGKKHGKWISYFEDGNLEEEEEYSHGSKTGTWKYYYPSGKMKQVENYDNDELNGETVYYFENGKIDMKKMYLNDEEEDTAFYYDASGELKHLRIFHHGHVLSYSYYGTDGKLVPPVNIENGTYHFVSYYKNGKKSKEYESVNGYYQGKFSEWYPDGKLQEETYYKDNLNHGTETSYYPDGKAEYRKNYFESNLQGPAIEYYPDGKIKKELHYKLNKLHGPAIYYDKNGKKIKEDTYYSGRVLKSVTF